MSTPAALHSSADPNWGTPIWILDAVREAFGGDIDLDPASSEAANVGVRAARFFAPPEDGLELPWASLRVFVNPPGGAMTPVKGNDIRDTRSRAVAWWRKAIRETLVEQRAGQLIFLAFSIELMQSAQSAGWVGPLDSRFSLCVPRKRIEFDRVAPDGSRSPGSSPSHGNLIVGIGCDPGHFERAFVRVGQVVGAKKGA